MPVIKRFVLDDEPGPLMKSDVQADKRRHRPEQQIVTCIWGKICDIKTNHRTDDCSDTNLTDDGMFFFHIFRFPIAFQLIDQRSTPCHIERLSQCD